MPRPVIRPYTASVQFDGSASELVKATPTGLNTGTDALSFVSWIYPKGSGLQVVADLLGGAMGRRFSIGQSGGVYYFFSDGVNAANNMTLTAAQYFAAFRPDAPARAVWTVDATEAQLYVNGVLIKTQALGLGMNSGTYTKLTIGRSGSATFGFNGWANDAYFANKKMTLADVQADYFSATQPSNVASAWMMGEGAGTNIVDRVGSNSLTATSITWSALTPSPKRGIVNGNMVNNGDFEFAPPFTAATNTTGRFIDGTASGSTTNGLFKWWLFITGGGAASASFDTTVSRLPNGKSIKLDVATGAAGTNGIQINLGAAAGPSSAIQRSLFLEILPNTAYTFTGYIKTSSVTSASAGVRFNLARYDGVNTGSVGSTASTYITGTNDFTLVTLSFTSEATARYLNVVMQMYNESGTAWFDDISLTPVFPDSRDQVSGNLVKNGDFEVVPTFVAAGTTQSRWVDGTAAGSTVNGTWKWKQQSGANATAVQFDTSVTHGGVASLKISATDTVGSTYVDIGAGIAASQSVSTLRSFAIPIRGGTSYTLTGWVKSNNVPTNGAFLQLTTYDANGTRVDNVGSSVKLTGTMDWTQITITQTVGASAAWATIGLMKNVAGNISDAWFDDIVFVLTTPDTRAAASARTAV